jgi:hypothetical protein
MERQVVLVMSQKAGDVLQRALADAGISDDYSDEERGLITDIHREVHSQMEKPKPKKKGAKKRGK